MPTCAGDAGVRAYGRAGIGCNAHVHGGCRSCWLRQGGFGAEDIYVMARVSASDLWGEPVNLGRTINSSNAVSPPDENKAVCSINDGGGKILTARDPLLWYPRQIVLSVHASCPCAMIPRGRWADSRKEPRHCLTHTRLSARPLSTSHRFFGQHAGERP